MTDRHSARSSRSQARVLLKLRRDPVTVVSLVLLVLVVAAALAAPQLAMHDPNDVDLEQIGSGILTDGHPLGTDQLGRDILSRLLYGARVSLPLAIVPVLLGALVGSLLGLISGYVRGWLDQVTARFTDALFSLPSLVLAIGTAAALGPSVTNAAIALTIVNVPLFARIMRNATITEANEDYVLAAQSVGAGTLRILLFHIARNVTAPLIVFLTLSFGRVMILAASLSFLGLGAQPPAVDWGGMVAGGQSVLTVSPHIVTIPGLAIFIIALVFNLLGDSLRDALDPKL